MKKLIVLLICIAFVTVGLAQTTNYIWSSGYTSNYIRQSLVNSNYTTMQSVTGAAPVSLLFSGLTTNVPVVMPNETNYFWFTNGILLLITNSPT